MVRRSVDLTLEWDNECRGGGGGVILQGWDGWVSDHADGSCKFLLVLVSFSCEGFQKKIDHGCYEKSIQKSRVKVVEGEFTHISV